MPNDKSITLEGVRIIFRNFSGKEGPYNREGNKEFAVLIDKDTAEILAADDWNVKWLRPRDENEEEEPQAYLPVALGYGKGSPPRVVLVTSRGRQNLDESQVEILDWATIVNVDLIVNPYEWNVQGKTGIKAYVRSMYVTIEEDELEKKYGDLEPA